MFFWMFNLHSGVKNAEELALIEAKALFNKDKATRYWASDLGGVYVPVSHIEPNPFLQHIKNRDITIEGEKFTLMNPAYMLRVMMSEYEEHYGVRGHITSLIHYRPETAPDEWEKEALLEFEAGKKEKIEVTNIANEPFLRLMQPLEVVESCLKCHGVQGYKVGDIRGGVSLSVPLGKYYNAQKANSLSELLFFVVFWLFGVVFVLFVKKQANC